MGLLRIDSEYALQWRERGSRWTTTLDLTRNRKARVDGIGKLSAGDDQLAEMWRPDKSLHQPRMDDTAADKRSAVGICMMFVGLVCVTSLSILGVRKRQC